MPEFFCPAGDVELCYETFGNPEDPALLLVMGLAMQMLGWHEDLCEELAGRGFFVIRYDNRDVGRSTSMPGRPPTTWQLIRRDKRAAAYQLADMAERRRRDPRPPGDRDAPTWSARRWAA